MDIVVNKLKLGKHEGIKEIYKQIKFGKLSIDYFGSRVNERRLELMWHKRSYGLR